MSVESSVGVERSVSARSPVLHRHNGILVRGTLSWRDSKVLDPLRGLYRKVKAATNRLLHPRRRRAARLRVERLLPVRRVVLLCLGNICRSPYGAARLVELGGVGRSRGGGPPRGDAVQGDADGAADDAGQAAFPGLEVRSAGLMGPGRRAPLNARRAAERRGLDLEPHISSLFDPELAAWAELFVVMDPGQAKVLEGRFGVSPHRVLVLGDLDPGSPDHRRIPDPLDRDEAFFLGTYERIDRCLLELFTLIGRAR